MTRLTVVFDIMHVLYRNQRKKKALADSKIQFSRVADENRTLLRQLEDTQRENYEVSC